MAKKPVKDTASNDAESGKDIRTGTSVASLKQAVLDNLYYVQGRLPELATRNDWYMAVAYTARDRMLENISRAQGSVGSEGEARELPLGRVPHGAPSGQ